MVLRQIEREMASIECGTDARKEFSFDESYTNLNHGSFGAIPSTIRRLQRDYQDASEAHPDLFVRFQYPPGLLASRQALASYLSAPTNTIVYVPNATTALNVILRNLVFGPNDVALYFSTIYGAIEQTLRYISETTPLTLHRVPVTYPLPDTAILSAFRAAIAAVRASDLTPRLAVYDTISSQPGIRVPFEALTQICKEEGILSVIDGAHSVGQIPLNLTELDADFFVSNCHKWLYVPRPCAVLYVALRNQALMRTNLPTSHFFVPREGGEKLKVALPASSPDASDFEKQFEFGGTLDSTAYLTVPKALEWRARVSWDGRKGEEAVYAWLESQGRAAGRTVAEVLGTRILEDEAQGACAFGNVRLPLVYGELDLGGQKGGEVDIDKVMVIGKWIQAVILEERGSFVALFWHGDAWWARLSAQIYLTIDDWKRCGEWLKDACDRVKARSW